MRIIPCEQCSIRSKSIAADIPADNLHEFRACTVLGFYRRRQVIFQEGTPANGLYIVCRGAVKLCQSDRFGREHILAVAEPGDVLGELPPDPAEPYSLSAEALTDTQVCFLPREHLSAFLRLHPTVGVHLVEALSKALSTARKKVRALALKPAESRLGELLLQLAGRPEAANGHQRIALAYSRREIAEMIGVSTETAIRLLAQLKRKRAIEVQHRNVVITDLAKLRRLANRDSIIES
jgi:CRP/FNR family transcriptional regulator, polysaccharide utilization system transcription regulator